MKLHAIPHLAMAGEFIVKAGWMLGPLSLDMYQIVYFPYASRTIFESGNTSYVLQNPCIILTKANEAHSYHFDPCQDVQHLFIQFRYQADMEPQELTDLQSIYVDVPETSLIPRLLSHILYLAHSKPDHWQDRSSLFLQSVLGELLCDAKQGEEHTKQEKDAVEYPVQILNALEYLENHLKDQQIIAEMAVVSGWSNEHFTRQFVRHTGFTPRSMIMKKRIDKACLLLIRGDLTIKEISYAVGIHDEHYFSRLFMKMKGKTAKQYRQKFADPQTKHLSADEKNWTLYPFNRYF
jgi:AraC family transcriptional regulator